MAFLVSFSLDGSSAIAGDTPASTGKVVVSLIAWKSLPRRCGKCERLGVALLTDDSQRARLGVHAFLGRSHVSGRSWSFSPSAFMACSMQDGVNLKCLAR